MSQLLKEEYNINVREYTKKDGTQGRVAYIDPQTSESVYPIKDEIKSKFGAQWDKFNKQWFWYLSNDESKNETIIKTKIYPCIDYLVSVEDGGQSTRNAEDVKVQVDPLLRAIDKVLNTPTSTPTQGNLKDRLASFKEDLINIMTTDEFKAKMEPIIKFRAAQGHRFSFLNAILVMIQDPEATLVKARSRWAKFNRELTPDAKKHVLTLWVPNGGEVYTKEQKEIIKKDYLKTCNVSSTKDLTPGQKEQLDILLKKNEALSFSLRACFYDVRFTKQMEGQEDLVGDPKAIENLEWFEDGEPNDLTVELADAITKTIEKSKVKLVYTDASKLGGARGMSSNGTIYVLKDAPKNAGYVNTLIHEFAHECLHQRYLSLSTTKKDGEWASYFVGQGQGRGQVEQQAELTAWIVLKGFNIDLPTSANYMACWGLDWDKGAANAHKVFDSVANVANAIWTAMKGERDGLNEDVQPTSGISGKDVANLVGLGKLYDKSKMMSMEEDEDEGIYESVRYTFNRFLKENGIRR